MFKLNMNLDVNLVVNTIWKGKKEPSTEITMKLINQLILMLFRILQCFKLFLSCMESIRAILHDYGFREMER